MTFDPIPVWAAGFLNVLMNCQWQSLLCQVQDGVLKMFRDEGCEECPQYTVQLKGSQVRPGPDTPQAYRITVVQHGDQVAVLEVRAPGVKFPLGTDRSRISFPSPYLNLNY